MSDPGATPGGDPRPRPRYGEYATAEEQRARIRDSDPTGSLHAAATVAHPAAATPAPLAPRAPEASAPQRPRMADRVATFALLGYGLLNVAMTVPGLLDFPALADLYFQIVGIPGSFTNLAEGQLWGRIAAVLLIVGYLITLWLSWRRVKSGRLTWWLPLVGALVTHAVVSICILVPFFGDPAFSAYLGGSVG